MHCKLNCITVNFEKRQHGIYTIQNIIISIHASMLTSSKTAQKGPYGKDVSVINIMIETSCELLSD